MARRNPPITLITSVSLTLLAGSAIAHAGFTSVQPSTADIRIVEQPNVSWVTPQRPVQPGVIAQIKAVDVDVRITDTLATTTMQLVVENQGTSTTQAQLVLPVPEGATIRTFGIDGIGDEPTAQLLPREEASRRYHEIVRSMTDPGLLEFVGSALIQSSVFPVEPGKQRTMTIVYEQSLDAHRGRVEYVLPRSNSLASSAVQWTIDIEVESSGLMGPVFSPSHPIVTKPVTDELMRVGVPVLSEPGAFRLYAVLGSGNEATALLYPDAEKEGAGYFMYVADAPELEQNEQHIRREVTIVIDRSGSMGGGKIEQARESARQIVRGMKMGEFVRIVDYADDVRSFSDTSVELTEESVEQVIAYIDNIQSRGGTNLHGALVDALSKAPAAETLPMVIFLTDGLATVGVTGESQIREAAQQSNASERRVFTFGVGYDVNAPLLDAIAMDTKAESTFVTPGEDVEMKVGQVFDKLDGPVMIDPYFGIWQADYANRLPKVFSVEPQELGDLFSGSRVLVLGRYEGLGEGNSQVWVMPETERDMMETVISGQRFLPIEKHAMFAMFSREHVSQQHAFVARLWAQQRINSLVNQIRLAGASGEQPNQELVDEIVRLSLEHGIMTEYTAFLADESMGLADASAPAARTRATSNFGQQNERRSGTGGFAQSQNRKNQDGIAAMQVQAAAEEAQGDDYAYAGGRVQSTGSVTSNTYFDADMRQVRVQTIQRGLSGTIYRKNSQWVDPQLGEDADLEPQKTIEFDTEAYWALLDDLVNQDRQWILSNRGEIYFLNHDERVLVKNPE
jgi:Ca-activated chloride channel family protein